MSKKLQGEALWKSLNFHQAQSKAQTKIPSPKNKNERSLSRIMGEMSSNTKNGSENSINQWLFEGSGDFISHKEARNEKKVHKKKSKQAKIIFPSIESKSEERNEGSSQIIYTEEIEYEESEENPMMLSLDIKKDTKTAQIQRWKQIKNKLQQLKEFQLQIRGEVICENKKLKNQLQQLNLTILQLTKKYETEKNQLLQTISFLQSPEESPPENTQQIEGLKKSYEEKIIFLQGELDNMSTENEILNEKLFDSEQKMAQMDLEYSKKAQKMFKKKEKEYIKQIQTLEEEIQSLSHQLLQKQDEKLHPKQMQLKAKEVELEEQFEEVARQHAEMLEKNRVKQIQLNSLQQKLLKKIKDFDERENKLICRANEQKRIPHKLNHETFHHGNNRKQIFYVSQNENKKFNKTFDKNYTESSPLMTARSHDRRSRGSQQKSESSNLDSLSAKLEKLQRQIRYDIKEAKQ